MPAVSLEQFIHLLQLNVELKISKPQVLLWGKKLPTAIRNYVLKPVLIYDSFLIQAQ